MCKKVKANKPKKEVKILSEEDIKKITKYYVWQKTENRRRKLFNE